ncbi:MAG TPA: hypothetical protein VIF62_27450, partial [Labilithrix sp.]
ASCLPSASYRDAPDDVDANDPDYDPGCVYALPCGLDPGLEARGCAVYYPDGSDFYECRIVEGQGCTADVYVPGPNGVTLDCNDCIAAGSGRRPRGLRARRVHGGWFARMAWEEAASVHAFERLARELREHGAPPKLARAADRAARDEVRHARVMTKLAGARVAAPRVGRPLPRSLEAIARENATEGVVKESFGALVLRWQAARAADPALRTALARIARDETRHAALARAVASWADARLDSPARRRVRAAKKRALATLRTDIARAWPALDARLGYPDVAAASALYARFAEHA